jgi:CHAD domain-containing protein
LPPLAHVDRAARRMARVVRHVREMDVAVKRLGELDIPVGGPQTVAAKEGVAAELRRKRTELALEKRNRIGKRARQLRAAVRTALPRHARAAPQAHDAGQEAVFQAFVEARVAARRAEVEQLFANARVHKSTAALVRATDELHRVRVAVKHWRYASEIARPAIPRALYRPMALELRQLQDLGGASQDFADLMTILRQQLENARQPSVDERHVLEAARAARDRAARAFADALGATFPRHRGLAASTKG